MNGLNCKWIITARPGFYVQLIFIDVRTQQFFDVIVVSVCITSVIYTSSGVVEIHISFVAIVICIN